MAFREGEAREVGKAAAWPANCSASVAGTITRPVRCLPFVMTRNWWGGPNFGDSPCAPGAQRALDRLCP